MSLSLGQTLPSHCPILCTTLMSCCDLLASCCVHFPSLHILPVSCSHTAEDTPPLTNPIVCPCHSLSLRLYLCLLAGMLLQDIYKLLTVWGDSVCKVPLLFPCSVLQAVLPPAGPACTFSPLIVCFSGGMAEGHQDGAL